MTPRSSHLQIHIASPSHHHTFFINQNIISTYSSRFKNIIKQYNKTRIHPSSTIQIDDFPGGPYGFELISRFCYNPNNDIIITVSNVALLHSCAVFLGMTEQVSTNNLIKRTQTFLDTIFYWSWNDIITCLRSCQPFLSFADSSGLLHNLVSALLPKILTITDPSSSSSYSSSSSSSPEDQDSSGSRFSASTKSWWFDDMAILPPKIIEKVVQGLGSYGSNNNSLVLTRFLLHYLKTAAQNTDGNGSKRRSEYGELADTAVHGVILVGKNMFSCRGLFWVLRVVSGFGLSKDCRAGLETVIGEMLDQAKLDDLLISGHKKCIYDVNLVIRLIRVFVNSDGAYSLHKLKKVGKLVDNYLGEISPDHNLKISKFLGVAEILPDCARDCFDGVYRAVDIYLETHPNLSMEERSRVCRCVNHEKLSLEMCKALAKNPRVPPRIAVEALMSQRCGKKKMGSCSNGRGRGSEEEEEEEEGERRCLNMNNGKYSERVWSSSSSSSRSFESEDKNEEIKVNLKKMKWRVVELEKVCNEMRSNMSSLVRTSTPAYHRALPRLC